MPKRIMLLGASILCVQYIRSLHEMGLEVFCVDQNPQAPALKHADLAEPVDISRPQACLEAARRVGIDGVLAINDFGVRSAAYLAQELGLPGQSMEVAELCLNKYLMRKTWQEAGLGSIAFSRVHSVAELEAAMSELPEPLIIKPANSMGGGSRGVRVIRPGDDPQELYDYANAYYRDDDILVEQCVEGLEHSLELLVYQGEAHIVATTDKVKSPLPYRVDYSILYPSMESGRRKEQMDKAAKDAVKAIGIDNGVAHVELAITESGPVLFELGARCGGGAPDPLTPYLSGVEQIKEAARLALGERPKQLEPKWQKGCVIRFWYPEPGIITGIHGVEKASSIPGVLSLLIFKKPGDMATPIRVCGDRAGMVITGAENRKAALEIADKVIEAVRFDTQPIKAVNN